MLKHKTLKGQKQKKYKISQMNIKLSEIGVTVLISEKLVFKLRRHC